MTDATIIRIAEETGRALEDAHPYGQCLHLVPSYNALLLAARANHPDDSFLGVLAAVPTTGDENLVSIAEMRALLGQLRIALESFEDGMTTGS